MKKKTEKRVLTYFLSALVLVGVSAGIGALANAPAEHKLFKKQEQPELKLVKEEKTTVRYYILPVRRDGVEVEIPVVQVGDTYYSLPMKKLNGKFVRVEPDVKLIPVKADYLHFAEKELELKGYKPVVKGEGKGKLYVVFDSMCPFCIKSVDKLSELKKKYREIVFLPLAVHGEVSLKGLSCIYQKSVEEGMEGALKEVFSWKKGKDWKEYAEKLSSCKLDKTVEKVSNLMREKGVRATPTFFLEEDGKFYERVGRPDFSLPKGE